jgi:hypothetical protein
MKKKKKKKNPTIGQLAPRILISTRLQTQFLLKRLVELFLIHLVSFDSFPSGIFTAQNIMSALSIQHKCHNLNMPKVYALRDTQCETKQ